VSFGYTFWQFAKVEIGMTLIFRIGLTISLMVLGSAQAQDWPYRLVCFEQSGVKDSLNKVTNAQQFLRNDSSLRSGSSDFAQIPSGSTARFVGIHASDQGFLYPLYRVTFASTGQRMYAADGIFRADQWQVKKRRVSEVPFLLPRSCIVLDGYIRASNRLPKYVLVPESCNVELIQ